MLKAKTELAARRLANDLILVSRTTSARIDIADSGKTGTIPRFARDDARGGQGTLGMYELVNLTDVVSTVTLMERWSC